MFLDLKARAVLVAGWKLLEALCLRGGHGDGRPAIIYIELP